MHVNARKGASQVDREEGEDEQKSSKPPIAGEGRTPFRTRRKKKRTELCQPDFALSADEHDEFDGHGELGVGAARIKEEVCDFLSSPRALSSPSSAGVFCGGARSNTASQSRPRLCYSRGTHPIVGEQFLRPHSTAPRHLISLIRRSWRNNENEQNEPRAQSVVPECGLEHSQQAVGRRGFGLQRVAHGGARGQAGAR